MLNLNVKSVQSFLRLEGTGGHEIRYAGVAEARVMFQKPSKCELTVPLLVLTEMSTEPQLIIGTNVLQCLPNWQHVAEEPWLTLKTCLSRHSMCDYEGSDC